ncbi:Tigger transposable element-derived protein 6 [Dictyocoela muelleri]|nr:Tigger transposable element-derived protein 6 [Dictyocoela muelleri]
MVGDNSPAGSYGCCQHVIYIGTLNGILKKGYEIIEEDIGNPFNIIKTNYKTKGFDEKLFEWFVFKRKRFFTIQDFCLQKNGLKSADIYKFGNFKASSGWLQKFKTRHNITSKFIKGESGLVDENVLEEFKDVYSKKLSSYNKADVFNCDETGLLFKCTPNKNLCHKGEELISGKFSKERVTILFCISMLGEKINPLIIGKSKTPRGFKNLDFKRLIVDYRHNKKACMNLIIIKEWLVNVKKKMKAENRKILLTLDNAPVHPVGVEYSNIELFYFLPNVTAKIQPLDQRIIKAFKSIYKKKLNNRLNFELDTT